jgi:hypothetical protein
VGPFLSDNEIEEEKPKLSLFPNPVQNELYLRIPETHSSSSKHVQICDATGRVVLSQINLMTNRIDVSALESGMYMLTVEGFSAVSFIKE